MDRIATSSAYSSILAELMAAENKQTAAGQLVSSQKIGDDLSGYGNQTGAVVATQSVKARVDGLVDQLKQTGVKLTVQQTALEQVSTIAQSLQQALTTAVGAGSGDSMMASVDSLFQQAVAALNTQYNGDYVFSGGQTSTQPFSATSLSDLTTQPSVSSFFQNGSVAPVSRVDDNSTMQTGFLATDVGQQLMTAFQSIQAFQQSASGNISGALTDAQQTFLTNAITQLSTVSAAASQTAGEGGDIQARVSAAQTTQTDRQSTLAGVLSGLTAANMADASTQLTQAQTAVQASAQVFTMLKGMSLLNYLTANTTG